MKLMHLIVLATLIFISPTGNAMSDRLDGGPSIANISLHPDFIVTARFDVSTSHEIISVKNRNDTLLLEFYSSPRGIQITYPEDSLGIGHGSGHGPDQVGAHEDEVSPTDDAVTIELVAEHGTTLIFAVFNNGELTGFLIVDTATGQSTYTSR